MVDNYLDEQLKQSYSKLVHEAHANQFLKNYLLSLQKEIEDNKKEIQYLRQFLVNHLDMDDSG